MTRIIQDQAKFGGLADGIDQLAWGDCYQCDHDGNDTTHRVVIQTSPHAGPVPHVAVYHARDDGTWDAGFGWVWSRMTWSETVEARLSALEARK